MGFGISIKKLREDAGISVEKLTGKIGVKATRWRKWEEKDLRPRDQDQQKIEAFFKLTLDEITALSSIRDFLNVQKSEDPSFVADLPELDGLMAGKENVQEWTPGQVMTVLARAYDIQAAAFLAHAETMKNIEKNMARKESQTRIGANVVTVLETLRTVAARQEADEEIVLHSMARIEGLPEKKLFQDAGKRKSQIEKAADKYGKKPA